MERKRERDILKEIKRGKESKLPEFMFDAPNLSVQKNVPSFI